VSSWSENPNVIVPSAALGGYDRIVVRRKNGDTTISSTTPQDIVPYKLAFNIYGIVGLKEQIVSAQKDNNSRIMAGLAPRQITICSWNIGHFALGAQKNSTITSSNYDAKLSAFRELIYDTINPRLIGLCEYSKVFGSNANGAQNANKVLFNDLAVGYEGIQNNYSCNALFANTYLSNIEFCQYECLQNETITHTSAIAATDYYYLQADLYLEGRHVKLVMTHLAFDNNRPSVLQVAQINELVQKMASYDRVILMGDWNVAAQSDYDGFVNAGYTLGNDGTIITHPSDNKALDSIIVKGVTMTNFSAVQSALSDNYQVVATISV
jgi:endonuclease/exonuclease/phosphatase family metal-dependent hydrolase